MEQSPSRILTLSNELRIQTPTPVGDSSRARVPGEWANGLEAS